MKESQQSSKTIRELEPGENITGFYAVRKTELKTKKDGSPYLLLELGDHSGRISATFWENAKALYDSIKVGDIVKVRGTVMMYKNSPQLSVERIRLADASDKVDRKAFVPTKNMDIDRLRG